MTSETEKHLLCISLFVFLELGDRLFVKFGLTVEVGANIRSKDERAATDSVSHEDLASQPPVDGVSADAADLGYIRWPQ
jgi:hypothetical protein